MRGGADLCLPTRCGSHSSMLPPTRPASCAAQPRKGRGHREAEHLSASGSAHRLGVEGVLPCEPLSTLPNRTTNMGRGTGAAGPASCVLSSQGGVISAPADSSTQPCWAADQQKGTDCCETAGRHSISVGLQPGKGQLHHAVKTAMWKSQMPRRLEY